MQFKTISHAYEESDRLADLRQDGLIADADYYPAIAEVNCWLNEFEIAERMVYAHKARMVGAVDRVTTRHLWKESLFSKAEVAS